MTQITVVPEKIVEQKPELHRFGKSSPLHFFPGSVATYIFMVILSEQARDSSEEVSEDMQDGEALRDAIAAAEAKGEKPIPLAEVRKCLGL